MKRILTLSLCAWCGLGWAQTAEELVKALADLLFASAVDADDDEERGDAREDHR